MNPDLISDYAVIGAGIAGASVAYRLSAHASVIVLEREAQPGYHSTGRSAAMFMETYGTPQIQALTRASRAFYENPPEGFTEHPLLHPRGVLYVATAEQRDLLQQTYDEFRRHSDNVRLIEPQAAAACPACAPSSCAARWRSRTRATSTCTACTRAFCAACGRAAPPCAPMPSCARPAMPTASGR